MATRPTKRKAKSKKSVFNLEILWVDIANVEPNTYNPNAMDDDRFRAFSKHIDEVGFACPIAVSPKKKDGKYIIIDGEHRWRYLKSKGADKCPCVVLSSKFDGVTLESQLASLRFNIHGENDTLRLGDVYQSAVDDGYTADTIAELLGETTRDICAVLAESGGPGGGNGPRDGDVPEFTEVIFTVPTEAWVDVVEPEVRRIIRLAKIKKHEDETVMFGQALELIAAQSAATPDKSFK